MSPGKQNLEFVSHGRFYLRLNLAGGICRRQSDSQSCSYRGSWRNRLRTSGYCGKPGLSVMTRSVIVPTACPLVSARQVRLCHSGLSVDEALYDASTG